MTDDVYSDHPKKLLQEWSQAHDLGLPVYRSRQTGGSSHRPLFTASCRVSKQVYSSHQELLSKKEAETDAALIALKALQSAEKAKEAEDRMNTEVMSVGRLSRKVIVIVDADNVDVPLDLIKHTIASFLFFVSMSASKDMHRYKVCPNAIIFPTPCAGKHATDIYLTYKTSAIRALFPDAEICIYTADHFGRTLATISQSKLLADVGALRTWVDSKNKDQHF